jgi:hypothetical protein
MLYRHEKQAFALATSGGPERPGPNFRPWLSDGTVADILLAAFNGQR